MFKLTRLAREKRVEHDRRDKVYKVHVVGRL
ncbi:MAG: hypothetical protein ACI91F_002711, partial [Candidatus Binatia bacterium]